MLFDPYENNYKGMSAITLSDPTGQHLFRTIEKLAEPDTKNPKAKTDKCEVADLEFALLMDKRDPLSIFTKDFKYPLLIDIFPPKIDELKITDRRLDKDITRDPSAIYLNGNSLGLPCVASILNLNCEILKWETWGSHGYFNSRTSNDLPWSTSENFLKKCSASLIGAKEHEIAYMNAVTVDIHLLLVSFYRPTKERYMIMMEDKAFPSDYFAIESHIRTRGLDPKEALIIVRPKEGKHYFETEDIIKMISEHGSKIALIFLSAVHYYTGQFFDVPVITKAGKDQGCHVGWNLTHAIGNVKVAMEKWDADFAVWSSYKYLNGGPGCIAGVYVNEKHASNDYPKYLGWWGNKFPTRMKMTHEFDPEPSPDVYKISNSPAFYVTILKASLEVFQRATMEKITCKSYLLTGYLYYLLYHSPHNEICYKILTPINPIERGNQISIMCKGNIDAVFVNNILFENGVICDVRAPDVLRMAPVPLYNTFQQVFRFYYILNDILSNYGKHQLSDTPHPPK